MATANKHKDRSHRSHRNTRCAFGKFEQNALMKKEKLQRQSFVKSLFHRTQDKEG